MRTRNVVINRNEARVINISPPNDDTKVNKTSRSSVKSFENQPISPNHKLDRTTKLQKICNPKLDFDK